MVGGGPPGRGSRRPASCPTWSASSSTAGPDVLVVRRRDGSLVEIRRGGGERAEAGAGRRRGTCSRWRRSPRCGWPAPETRGSARWLLRAAEGWTGRGNSVLPLRRPRPAAGRGAGRGHRLVRRARAAGPVPVPTPAREAARRGAGRPGLVVVQPDGGADRRPGGHAAARCRQPTCRSTVEAEPDADWLSLYHYRGAAELPPVARRVLAGAREPGFAVLRDRRPGAGDRPRARSTRAGSASPRSRSTPATAAAGLGTAVMRAILDWGRWARRGQRVPAGGRGQHGRRWRSTTGIGLRPPPRLPLRCARRPSPRGGRGGRPDW